MSALRILRAAVLASLIVPAVGHAQSPPAAPIPQTPQPTPPSASQPTSPATPSATPSGAPEMSPTTRAAVDERIAKLRSQLVITEVQMPLWSAFAQTMRDNAATTDALFARRAGAVSEMNAVDNMHSYAQIARAYADNTDAWRPRSTASTRAFRTSRNGPPTRCSDSRRSPPASHSIDAEAQTSL